MSDMFEVATREKMRFGSSRGPLSVEQLWDVPLTSTSDFSLDVLAVGLNEQLNETQTISFVHDDKVSVLKKELQFRFDLVKHIIDVKLKEKKEKEAGAVLDTKKRELEALIASKKQEKLVKETPVEELEEMLKELEK